MTWAIHHDLPKDESHSVGSVGAKEEYGAINQHLRNHIHLTNCIHLKNHMHRHSPTQSEKSLLRDLVVLQRSKSLRDPSTSPPSWLSPFVISTLVKRSGEDAGVHSGRRSIGVDIGREVARLSARYPKTRGAVGTIGDHSAGKESRDDEIRKGEDCSRLNLGEKASHPSLLRQNSRLKTLSEQLEEIPSQTSNEIRAHRFLHTGQLRGDERSKELKMSGLVQYNGLSRKKRRKFRSARRAQGSVESKSGRVHNNISVASSSFTQGIMNRKCCSRKEGDEEENEEVDATQASRHGCGIPWNWSRLHHRGKTFLDIAGRSLSCGLSDSKLKKDEEYVQQSKRDKSKMPISSQQLTSSTGSDSEALPFLLDPLVSPESNINHCLTTACSGELGLYADNNGQEVDSDLVLEARSPHEPESRGYFQGRHQSLTQKYMPKTFKDLVGQSLVVQALTNAVLRKKVGLIYVFYGPHGTGKTSCARVFAKSLNCQSAERPKPCDLCTSCISHNLGKSRNLLEVGAASSFDNGRIVDALNDAILSASTSQYRVFIVDDCDILPSDAWMVISKVAHHAQRHVVLILISSSLDHLPHVITSRCHKFYFPKIKESEIVLTLQWISTSEGLDIDKDALKLIASRSDGSLRDAEMTLDQLSLLGQKISLPLVQELVGLVSDEKLVELLDVALSADTVNTIKSVREITEAGVDPLSLMSQLATLITDILAGSYIFNRERLQRNFFRRQTLSKEDMEKLRQALRTLSETEKNIRLSTDKLTWLTAALLQIVPDQQYAMPSLIDSNYNQTPLLINSTTERLEVRNAGIEGDEEFYNNGELNRNIGLSGHREQVIKNSMQVNRKIDNNNISGKEHLDFIRNGMEHSRHTPEAIWSAEEKSSYRLGKSCKGYGKLWRKVIENIQSDALKLFLSQEGRLGSIHLGSAPTVQLIFDSSLSKSKAEKYRGQILQAFTSVLNTTVILEIRCNPQRDIRDDVLVTHDIRELESDSSRMTAIQQSISKQSSHTLQSENATKSRPKEISIKGSGFSHARELQYDSLSTGKDCKGKGSECTWVGERSSLQQHGDIVPLSERKAGGELNRSKSLVKSKVSLAHVIQQAEGCSNQCGWSTHKTISIAEKLEQENMRLEPRSKKLLCWKDSRATRSKRFLSRVRARNPRYLLKLVTCSRCLSSRSPR